jgi:hypothetical protein
MRYLWFPLGCTLLLASAVLPAQQESDPDEPGAVSGQIVELAPDRLTIRPWSHKRARRMQIRLQPGARLLEQRPGRVQDLQKGELVLVLPGGSADVRNEGEKAERGEKAPRARAILRFWPVESVTAADRHLARALLRSAGPLIRRRIKTEDANRAVVGIVDDIKPLTLRVGTRVQRFNVPSGVPVVRHQRARKEELKAGLTVLIHSESGIPEDEAIEAGTVAVAPRPRISAQQQRKLLLREERRGN